MSIVDEVHRYTSRYSWICDHCGYPIERGQLIGAYRGRVLCEACADHKQGELLFYGMDLEDDL